MSDIVLKENRSAEIPTAVLSTVVAIPVGRISSSPHQARRSFPKNRLKELADSIKKRGVIVPIRVRQIEDGFQIIAGERRWRAAKMAECKTIPALVDICTDEDACYSSLAENIQRENLGELDEAYTFAVLAEKEGGTKAVADQINKSVTYVEDRLALLKLSEEVQRIFAVGRINMAQAKILGEIADPAKQLQMAQLAASLQLSANQLKGRTEHLTHQAKPPKHGHGIGGYAVRHLQKATFTRIQTSVIELFEILEALDTETLSVDEKNTLNAHFQGLIEALTEAKDKLAIES